MIINRSFQTLIVREIWRFLSLYKQTIMPGAISSSLYIIIFGHALGTKIGDIGGVPYMHYIIPGLIMMSVVTHDYQNSPQVLCKQNTSSLLRIILSHQ